MRFLPAILLVVASSAAFGQTFTEIGSAPPTQDPLVQAADGNLYGTGFVINTSLFRVSLSGTSAYTTVPDPSGGTLIITPDGNFLSMSALPGMFSTAPLIKTDFQGESHNFLSTVPQAGVLKNQTWLTLGADGNYYGVSAGGGAFGYGFVFSVTQAGIPTLLYSFTGDSDGATPSGPLLQASNGALYGETFGGGNTSSSAYHQDIGLPFYSDSAGFGTIFSITTDGQFQTLYTFSATADGLFPTGGLVQATDGNLYGVTYGGGNTTACPNTGCGTVFKISTAGTLNTVYTVASVETGFEPEFITAATDGNFYVTSGNTDVFEVTPAGVFTNIHNFQSVYAGPNGLVQASDGNLYGAAVNNDSGNGQAYSFFYRITPAQTAPAPVQLTAPSSATVGSAAAFSFNVPLAISLTQQQCYAYQFTGSYLVALGKVTGTYNTATQSYSGTFSITPQQSGQLNYGLTCGGTVSGTATLAVTPGSKSHTAASISGGPIPLYQGQTATLNIAVTRTASSGSPGGSAVIYLNDAPFVTLPLNSQGKASTTVSTAGIGPGYYTLSATYQGDSADEPSYAPAVSVNLLATTKTITEIAAGPDPVTQPEICTITAKVTADVATPAPSPTGTVTFAANGVAFASAPVNSSGIAQIAASSSQVPAGTYNVTATYVPTAAFASSSASTSITVRGASNAGNVAPKKRQSR